MENSKIHLDTYSGKLQNLDQLFQTFFPSLFRSWRTSEVNFFYLSILRVRICVIASYFQVNWSAYHSIMDVGRRHETLESETKDSYSQ